MKKYKPLTIFLQGPGSIFGKLVSYFTKSKIAHVFISIENGYFIEADLFGIRIFDSEEFKKRNIVTAFELENIDNFLDTQKKIDLLTTSMYLKNKPYDYFLTISFLFKRLFNIGNAYNCVETIKYLLDSMGIENCFSYKNKPCDFLCLREDKKWREIK